MNYHFLGVIDAFYRILKIYFVKIIKQYYVLYVYFDFI